MFAALPDDIQAFGLPDYQGLIVLKDLRSRSIVQLAYIFLWLTAGLVEDMPHSREKPAAQSEKELASPTRTQRDDLQSLSILYGAISVALYHT